MRKSIQKSNLCRFFLLGKYRLAGWLVSSDIVRVVIFLLKGGINDENYVDLPDGSTDAYHVEFVWGPRQVFLFRDGSHSSHYMDLRGPWLSVKKNRQPAGI